MNLKIFTIIIIVMQLLSIKLVAVKNEWDTTNNSIDIYVTSWYSTSTNNDINKLMRVGFSDNVKIIIHNENFLKLLKNELILSKINTPENDLQIDYRMMVILRDSSMNDTVIFNRTPCYMIFNSKIYEVNWGLFSMIIQKLPIKYKNSAELFLSNQLYNKD